MIAMVLHRTVVVSIVASLAAACSGCGGRSNDSSPQGDRNLYGRSLQELQNAAATTNDGATSLRAWAQQRTYDFTNVWDTYVVDLQTGTPRFNPSLSTSSISYWIAAAALVDANEKPVLPQWRPRTMWFFKGADFISPRNISAADDTVFWASYPSPPFSRDGAKFVVEFVLSQVTRLATSTPAWTG